MDSSIAIGAALLWTASLCWLVGTTGFALLQPLKRRSPRHAPQLPAVSIIVPTSIVDDARSAADRRAALASLLALDYPSYEVLVCIDRGSDDGRLAGELRRTFPPDRIRVLVAADQSSASAKVDAMASGAAAARHDVLLFCDDDVQLDPRHLTRLVAQQASGVGMVSAAAIGIRPENLWGELELAFMNGQFARMHLTSDFLGIGGALGKSMLLTRTDIERAGGLLRTGGDCCEDAALTQNLGAVGLRTVLGDLPVRQPIGLQRFGDVWRRHRRWLSCRRKYIPASFAAEALFSAPVASLAGAVACRGLALDPVAGAVATAGLWCAIDSLLIVLSRWHWSPLTPLAWLLREVLFLPLWASALFARTVLWYGRPVPVTGNRGS